MAAAIPAILLGTGAAVAGAGFMSRMRNMVGQVHKPQELPQPPKAEDVVAKAEDAVKKKRAAISQTVYTSPLGVAGEAQVARKTLLGQ